MNSRADLNLSLYFHTWQVNPARDIWSALLPSLLLEWPEGMPKYLRGPRRRALVLAEEIARFECELAALAQLLERAQA